MSAPTFEDEIEYTFAKEIAKEIGKNIMKEIIKLSFEKPTKTNKNDN